MIDDLHRFIAKLVRATSKHEGKYDFELVLICACKQKKKNHFEALQTKKNVRYKTVSYLPKSLVPTALIP